MTLDLGFAHLVLEDGSEAGIVDVPGHERFIHNMLAGAAGMELMLLVIAANEGVMPQTIEHLQILKYLNVGRTLVVLTKCDLVSDAELARRRIEIGDSLRTTIARDAPILAVSSTTGSGLRELRIRIAALLRELQPRDVDAPIYLPIDRVFTLPGHGTILTGTLMQGSISLGETVLLEPQRKHLRVRALQIFGAARERVTGGTRVALNLGGISHHEVTRGSVIVSAQLQARSSFDVRFVPLAEALPLLRRRTSVRAYIGAAEIVGTLRFESAPTSCEEMRGELTLRTPTVGFPGVRFVLRRLSPKTLLGGGVIEGETESLAASRGMSAVENVIHMIIRERGFQSIDATQAAFLANLREEIAASSLERLLEQAALLKIARPLAYVDAVAAAEALARTLDALEAAHEREPWALGLTSLALARALSLDEGLLVRVLAAFAECGRLSLRGGYYATLAHAPTLSSAQAEFFASVSAAHAQSLVPRPYDGVLAAVKESSVIGLARAFDALLARGAFVKVGEDLYHEAQIAQIQAKLAGYLREHGRLTMAEFRDLIGTSRKYAVPLLEWFDSRSITMREGDYRRMRRT